MPRIRFNEAKAFIDSGLQDVSLSRARLSWGVRVPWDESHVFYVWFDALLNYVTALSFARPGEDLTARFWPATFHLIGKDILKFHTVFWPALLMAAGLTSCPSTCSSTGSCSARRRARAKRTARSRGERSRRCPSRAGTSSTRSR